MVCKSRYFINNLEFLGFHIQNVKLKIAFQLVLFSRDTIVFLGLHANIPTNIINPPKCLFVCHSFAS